MNRIMLAMTVMALALTPSAGVALAANVYCNVNLAALCVGTNVDDEFEGEDVNDSVQGRLDIIEGLGAAMALAGTAATTGSSVVTAGTVSSPP
jgi:hypothetical protein